jgi:D-alanine--poly(phosphoribitol) ligase subunit 1
VGVPKPDCRIAIMDDEIVIAGPNVSPGYLNRPDLTQARFFELEGARAYRTGDQGHFERELLFFDGRFDDQIKLHGYRIELGDVEANLRALPEIREAVVVPLYRGSQVDAIAAFVSGEVLQGETAFEATLRLRRALGERLPVYMVPRIVQFVEHFPLTPNGKVDRRGLASTVTLA